MEQNLYTIIVHSENVAGVLNQVTAVFTRRQINIESLNVSASSIPGVHKYTITAMTDPDTMEKVAKQISKKIDVVQTQYYTDDDVFQHEIALYKLKTHMLESNREVGRVIRRFGARIVDVTSTYSIVVHDGMSAELTAMNEQLMQLDCVLQFVRSGRVVVTKSSFERVDEYLEKRGKKFEQRGI